MAKQGLSSIGIDVKIDSHTMNYVTEIGDIGGAPSDLDATCMKDKMTHNVPGVKQVSAWTCNYLFDNSDTDSDYRALSTIESAGEIVPVVVTFPDGSKFSTTGYVTNQISGVAVDALIGAVATVSIQTDWVPTNPTTTE